MSSWLERLAGSHDPRLQPKRKTTVVRLKLDNESTRRYYDTRNMPIKGG